MKVFGIIGNPVSHSKSPLIHNTAFQSIGFDGVYVPLLVDDLSTFLGAFSGPEWGFQGFSVTIPHKEAALKLAKTVDPVAEQIGAVNTLIRQPDGSFKGYNTDSSAAVGAVERALVQAGKGDLNGKASRQLETCCILLLPPPHTHTTTTSTFQASEQFYHSVAASSITR